jgi:hypothetical protein
MRKLRVFVSSVQKELEDRQSTDEIPESTDPARGDEQTSDAQKIMNSQLSATKQLGICNRNISAQDPFGRPLAKVKGCVLFSAKEVVQAATGA